MISAPRHPSEASRLESLRRYEILDSELDARFQLLAEQATAICGVPIALISLIDENRQWFKARVGVDVTETPRELAFCAHAILQEGVFEVPDARLDQRFHDNPLVTGPAHVVFYAGMPIHGSGGLPLGTVCAVDTVPHRLSDAQRDALRMLGRQVEVLLEARQRARLAMDAPPAAPESLVRPEKIAAGETSGPGDAPAAAHDAQPIEAVRRAPGWSSCRETVAQALTDFFRKPLRPHAEWSTEDAMRIATMVQLDTTYEVALTLDLRIEPAFLRSFASQLFGSSADERAERAVLFESANIVMGAIKRSFESTGFRPTMGLPRERSAAEVDADLSHADATQFQLFDVDESLVAVTLGLRQRSNHRLPASQLTEGMVLAADVRDASGALVAARGTRLTTHTIGRIAAADLHESIAVGGLSFV
jgi:hypothetical protein